LIKSKKETPPPGNPLPMKRNAWEVAFYAASILAVLAFVLASVVGRSVTLSLVGAVFMATAAIIADKRQSRP